jgi:hypothetical protein
LKHEALKRGIRHLHLMTASHDLEGVLRFYRRQGFAPWGFQAYLNL